MYFVLSKTVGFFAVPTNLICSLGVVGLALLLFGRRSGKTVSFAALAAFLVMGLSPLGNMLLTPLEQRFPGQQYPDRIDGIIILGGSYDTQIRSDISTVILGENSDPMTLVAALARRYPDAKIIASGGSNSLVPVQTSEAEIARKLFVSFGIDPRRIVIEDQSRNTEENARLTRERIQPSPQSRWLLVTSAYHMPRAMGVFRKAGFNVLAFPAGWRTHGWGDLFQPTASATENFRRVDVAMHEWVGLAVYWLLGKTNALFPAY